MKNSGEYSVSILRVCFVSLNKIHKLVRFDWGRENLKIHYLKSIKKTKREFDVQIRVFKRDKSRIRGVVSFEKLGRSRFEQCYLATRKRLSRRVCREKERVRWDDETFVYKDFDQSLKTTPSDECDDESARKPVTPGSSPANMSAKWDFMMAGGVGIFELSSVPLLLVKRSRCSSSLAKVDELKRREEMKYVLKTARQCSYVRWRKRVFKMSARAVVEGVDHFESKSWMFSIAIVNMYSTSPTKFKLYLFRS